jgi:hypothetical protein
MTITGPTIKTNNSGNFLQIRDDGSAGVIEFFSGVAGETAGKINPGSVSGFPFIDITSGKPSTGVAATLRLEGSLAGATINTPNVFQAYGGLDVHGGLTMTGGFSSNSTMTTSGTSITCTGGSIHASPGGLWDDALTGGGTTGASIGNGGRIVRTTSSRRYKYAIRDLSLDHAREVVRGFRARTFKRKKPGDGTPADRRRYAGAIAEELAEIPAAEPFIVRDDKGRPDGIHYAELIAVALPVLADLEARVEALEAENTTLRSRLDTIVNLGGIP